MGKLLGSSGNSSHPAWDPQIAGNPRDACGLRRVFWGSVLRFRVQGCRVLAFQGLGALGFRILFCVVTSSYMRRDGRWMPPSAEEQQA